MDIIRTVIAIPRALVTTHVKMLPMMLLVAYIAGANAGVAAADPTEVRTAFDDVESNITYNDMQDHCTMEPRPELQCTMEDAMPEVLKFDPQSIEYLRSKFVIPYVKVLVGSTLSAAEFFGVGFAMAKEILPSVVVRWFATLSSFGAMAGVFGVYLLRAKRVLE